VLNTIALLRGRGVQVWSISAARQTGTRFGRPLSDPMVIADKLAIAQDARATGRTAEDTARLVGWSRTMFYRRQQARAAIESTIT
jgi:hypothetical protein